MLRKVALVCCALLVTSCATIGVPQPTPTVAPTLTPSRTFQQTALAQLPTRTPQATSTAIDAPTQSSTPNPSLTGTDTSTPTNTLTATPTLRETPTTTATLTPSRTPTATTTPTITPSPTDTSPPSNTPLPRFEPTATETPSSTPTDTLTPSITPSLSPTPSNTFTPEPTNTFTPSATLTPSLTYTPQPSLTSTVTITSSATSTVTATTTPSVTVSSTSGPPSTTPTFESTATATFDPFFTTEAPTWTPFPTGTATPTVTIEPGPTLDLTPVVITLQPSDPPPAEALPTEEDALQGEPTQETFLPTPTTVFPTVVPVAPPPTIEFAPAPVGVGAVAVGALPFTIGPGVTGADFNIPAASDGYEPFQLVNPRFPTQSVVTDEFGAMYWVHDGERTALPEPFSSFGPDSLENSDRLVRAAAWSPDGTKVAFVVDNPRRGDANDGVWWWEVGTGRAYQVMHNCRRQVRNCGDFVNATTDPYINTPPDQSEEPNTGWYAQSVSWSPDNNQILARLRIRDDQRLAFIVLPATMDDNFRKQRGNVCKYELSDWSENGFSVLVAGRDSNDQPVLGVVESPYDCSEAASLVAETVDQVRVTPVSQSSSSLPEGIIAGSEFEAGQQLQINSSTGGLNLRTRPAQSAGVHRYVLNGEYVRLLAGPLDAEGYRWWRVQTSEGTQGWMAGSSGNSQLLFPAS